MRALPATMVFALFARVSVPLPSLVRPAVPVMDAVSTVVAPAPPTVRRRAPLATPPESVSVPKSELIRESFSNITAPLTAFTPDTLRNAPGVTTRPVPLRLTLLAIAMPPCSSSAAPALTVMVLVPAEVALRKLRAPALTVVAPE